MTMAAPESGNGAGPLLKQRCHTRAKKYMAFSSKLSHQRRWHCCHRARNVDLRVGSDAFDISAVGHQWIAGEGASAADLAANPRQRSTMSNAARGLPSRRALAFSCASQAGLPSTSETFSDSVAIWFTLIAAP